MKYICVLFILFLHCSNPDFSDIQSFELFFNPSDFPYDSSNSLLKNLKGAKQSISCNFKDIDPGLPTDYPDYSKSEEAINKKILMEILSKYTEGVKIRLILQDECKTPGSILAEFPEYFNNNKLSYDELLSSCMNHSLRPKFNKHQEINFINNIYSNYCVIDNSTLWFSMNPLNGYSNIINLSFILSSNRKQFFTTFGNEINRLMEGLSGKLKSANNKIMDFNISGSQWKVFHGPQDNPLSEISALLKSSKKTLLFSTGISSDLPLQNPLESELQNHLLNNPDFEMILWGSDAFNKGSFFQENKIYNHIPLFKKIHFRNIPRIPDKFQFLLLTQKDGSHIILLLTGEFSETKSLNQNTTLIEITSDSIYNDFLNIWSFLKKESPPFNPPVIQTNSAGLKVTELFWMGSIDNFKSREYSDEGIEIYNNSSFSIPLGNIQFACTNNNGFSVSDYIEFPQGAYIDPESFYSISKKSDGAIPDSNLIISEFSLSNNNQECLLIDKNIPSPVFYPPSSVSGHYNDNRLTGKIISKVLSYTGPTWNKSSSDFFSRTGFNTLKYSSMKNQGARSMELNFLSDDPALLENWHTNYLSLENNIKNKKYIFYTFHTLGRMNSLYKSSSSGIILNEIHWMGSYDISGISYPNDEFIEIYNPTSETLNIGSWIFGCTTAINQSGGKPYFALPPDTLILPGQYLTISSTMAKFVNKDLSFPFSIPNTITQCLLTDGNPYTKNFFGIDSNGNGIIEGNYDNNLFFGNPVDFISDGSNTLSSYGLGINDTSLKIRRSAERISPQVAGDLISNWKTNSFLTFDNTFVFPDFRSNTFASPDSQNSP